MSPSRQERRENILNQVYQNGHVEVVPLSADLGVSEATVRREEAVLRAEHYGALRGARTLEEDLTLERLRELADLGRLEIAPGSRADGCTLRELAVREHTGATVVALDRAGDLQPNPPADLRLRSGDALLVYGTGEQLASVGRLLAQRQVSGP